MSAVGCFKVLPPFIGVGEIRYLISLRSGKCIIAYDVLKRHVNTFLATKQMIFYVIPSQWLAVEIRVVDRFKDVSIGRLILSVYFRYRPAAQKAVMHQIACFAVPHLMRQ